jgi:integrase
MASIQARHSRSCALGDTFRAVDKIEGCTCTPSLWVFVHQDGKTHKHPAGKNRKQAERLRTKLQGQEDEQTFEPIRNVRFSEWGDSWPKSLERKPSTIRSYETTMSVAKQAFGGKHVRAVTPGDVAALNVSMKERGVSESTRAKHLRVLNACFASAMSHGYAGSNPVRALRKSEKPSPESKESAYFVNEELPRLFAAIPDGLYRVLFETALKTGMRLGELTALTWGDIDFDNHVIHVRKSYTDGALTTPKNRRNRPAHVSPDVVELLAQWWGECGSPTNDAVLVFPGERKHSYLSDNAVRRELYEAMETAKVPRIGQTGEKRAFHSFRHTYAKRALESGRPVSWLSRHLGHSSVNVTTEVYGHWEAAERKREADLMAGVFGF